MSAGYCLSLEGGGLGNELGDPLEEGAEAYVWPGNVKG